MFSFPSVTNRMSEVQSTGASEQAGLTPHWEKTAPSTAALQPNSRRQQKWGFHLHGPRFSTEPHPLLYLHQQVNSGQSHRGAAASVFCTMDRLKVTPYGHVTMDFCKWFRRGHQRTRTRCNTRLQKHMDVEIEGPWASFLNSLLPVGKDGASDNMQGGLTGNSR